MVHYYVVKRKIKVTKDGITNEYELPDVYIKAWDTIEAVDKANAIHNTLVRSYLAMGFELENDFPAPLYQHYQVETLWLRTTVLRKGNISVVIHTRLIR